MAKPRISPSRLKLYSECPRKWAIAEVLGINVQRSSSRLGTVIHAGVEAMHLGTRHKDLVLTDCDQPALASARIKQIYDWLRTHDLLGGTPEYELPKGGDYAGRADYVVFRDGRLSLIDYKTTRWGEKYTSRLTHDYQAHLYARALMDAHGVDTCECIWLYVSTEPGPRPLIPVYFFCRREDTQDAYERAMLYKEHMLFCAEQEEIPRAEWHVNPETDVCKAYGGCPYESGCKQMGALSVGLMVARECFGGATTIHVAEKPKRGAPKPAPDFNALWSQAEEASK